MRKILSFAAICLTLTSCTVMEPKQNVVVSSVEHKSLKPFAPQQKAFEPTPAAYPGARKIAVLLPLSGQYRDLGQAMLHASEMAFFEAGNSSNVVLLPKDTHSQADGAHQAAQEAINEGADVILGPIFSREVSAVKMVAQGQNIPVLSFSTDTAVAAAGTYTLGFLPSQQVERIVRYAAHQGHKRIVALTPKTEYGQLLSQSLQTMRQNGEVVLVDVLPYDPSQMFTGSSTMQQVIEKLHAAKSQGATAVLFPSGGIPLSAFVAAVKVSDLHDLKILGTGQWDTPNIHQTPGLEGGWFASPDSQGRAQFEQTYQQQFSKAPPRIASLAYDATALAVALAPHQYAERHLLSPHGYSGLDGLFRLRQDGTAERSLAVMEVSQAGVHVVHPASTTF